MKQKGILKMLEHEYDIPVRYFFITENKNEKTKTFLNDYINQKVSLHFSLQIYCIHCGKKTKKSFAQGSCYSCFIHLAKNDICILKPEKCHYHLGTCREPEWGEKHCFKTHKVYFADTGTLKVGISKEDPISKRWIDQGANSAIEFLEVESRMKAGLVETTLKKRFNDKTNWRKMLSWKQSVQNFQKVCTEAKEYINQTFQEELNFLETERLLIQYPIETFPEKIQSYNLMKQPKIEDTLLGIKGQYLIFKNAVLNIRSYAGYEVEFSVQGHKDNVLDLV